MSTLSERRLQAFVDRHVELDEFCAMLDNPDRPIFAVSGGGGIGKSSLLLRLTHECSLRGITRVEVDFSSTRHGGYLALMRKARDDIGAARFAGFTDLVNYFTVPDYRLNLGIAADSVVSVRQNIGAVEPGATVTGVNVSIRDLMVVVPRQDLSVLESERMALLTDRFLAELEQAAADGLIVFLFDHLEKAPGDTRTWIWRELLRPLATGGLRSVRFVLFGRDLAASADESGDLWPLVIRRELHPLGLDDIAEYLLRRPELSFDERVCRIMAAGLLEATKGLPLMVATAVEAMAQRGRLRGPGGE